MAQIDTDLVKKFIAQSDVVKQKKGDLDEEKKALASMEAEVLAMFEEAGTDSIRIDGQLAYLHRQLWARVMPEVDKAEVCEAFRSAGLPQFVNETFNTNTVSSWLRDLEKEGEPIPQELQGLITGYEQFGVRTRKA